MSQGKIHISDDGVARKCTATKRPCKLSHFDSKAEAEAYTSKKLEEKFGNTPAVLKKPETEKSETITLNSSLGVIDVTDGDLSKGKTRAVLVSGLCGDLAMAIHRKTGGDPYFICFNVDSEEELNDQFDEDPEMIFHLATHVMIESPTEPNKYIDSYGQKSIRDIQEFYGYEATIIQGNIDMLKIYSYDSNPGKLSKFADTVIEMDAKRESYEYEEYDVDEEDDYEESIPSIAPQHKW